MPAFFIISGFFAAMVISRRGEREWIAGRWSRVGVPLLMGTIVLGPIEQIAENYFNGVPGGLSASLNISLGELVRHRWFLITLLLLCTAAYAGWPLVKRKEILLRVLGRYAVPSTVAQWLGLVVFLILGSFGAIVAGKVIGDIIFHSAFIKQHTILFAKYLPFFVIGLVVFQQGSMQKFSTGSPLTAAAAIVTLTIYLAVYFAFYEEGFASRFAEENAVIEVVRLIIDPLAAYLVSRFFFMGMAKFFNKANKIVDYLVDGALCIYLVHMFFVVVAAGYLLDKPFNATLELLTTFIFATVGAVATCEVIRRSNFLSWALNGQKWTRRSEARA
jgi:glucan biosynthesis protein C